MLDASPRAALSERGEGFGSSRSRRAPSCCPREATDPTRGAAARRPAGCTRPRAAARELGRSARPSDVLLRVLREREPELDEHLRGVARLAARDRPAPRASTPRSSTSLVARRRAARHRQDRRCPDRILHKPGHLDDDEWALMRTEYHDRRAHPRGGSGDGAGRQARAFEPRALGRDRVPGPARRSAIPFGRGAILVCDAFEAMTERTPIAIGSSPRPPWRNFGDAPGRSSTPRSSTSSPSWSVRRWRRRPSASPTRARSRPGAPPRAVQCGESSRSGSSGARR